jgi:hypothetical protein
VLTTRKSFNPQTKELSVPLETPIGCLVRRTSNQTINKETVTVLSWSAEVYDDGGCWSSANPTRLVVPAGHGGLWAISWSAIVLPSGMTGEKELWFRLNGDETKRLGTQDFTSTADMQLLTVVTRLEAGDYIECCGYLETSENGQFADDEYGVCDDLQRCRFERIR